MKKWIVGLTPLLLFLLLAAFFWRGLSLKPQDLPSALAGKPLPAFELPVLGEAKTFTRQELPKNWFILNVWASWCEACVEEQAFLLRLAREGVLLYGLNYKDEPSDALSWLKTWGNPYQVVLRDPSGQTAIDLGVYGAPESFLINEQGNIVYRHAGVLDEKSWHDVFVPRIAHDHS
ncbi:MAG: DsbE family thiol:disulfide interchange protein [Legionellaceae bacterium]|nr:DsbE family thiol:disulfide interchange protein [Legionellaceae bacterium]